MVEYLGTVPSRPRRSPLSGDGATFLSKPNLSAGEFCARHGPARVDDEGMKWLAIGVLALCVACLFVRMEVMQSRLDRAEGAQKALDHVRRGIDRVVEGLAVLKDMNERLTKVEAWAKGHPK